jgi:hypothetical protein
VSGRRGVSGRFFHRVPIGPAGSGGVFLLACGLGLIFVPIKPKESASPFQTLSTRYGIAATNACDCNQPIEDHWRPECRALRHPDALLSNGNIDRLRTLQHWMPGAEPPLPSQGSNPQN